MKLTHFVTRLSKFVSDLLLYGIKQGFFQLFAQGGAKWDVWIIGGGGGMLPQEILILDLLLDAI